MYPYPEIPRARIAELHQQADRAALAIAIRRARRARSDRSGPSSAAARIIRSLATAIARAGAAAMYALGAIWAARSRLPGEPAGPRPDPRPQPLQLGHSRPGAKAPAGAQPPATFRTAGAANSGTSIRT
jgi:hypothetical protein